ncbi:MAG: SPFH domain-containing protein, partial [Spirochaetota bacterium]
MNNNIFSPQNTKTAAAAAVIGIFFLIILFGSWFFVGAGIVGVTFNTMTGETHSYSQGFYFKIPLVTDVTKFDVKTQRQDIRADSASMDLQKVAVHVVVNYHLDYAKVNELYVKVGVDYEDKVIAPAVNES